MAFNFEYGIAKLRAPVPFGKYYLLDRINIGGMAEVFQAKAFGVEGFERFVAVKKILPSIAEDEEFINMFIDEAKICVQLNHANIAQIFDLGKVGDSYFIAMEFVSGRDTRAMYNRARKLGHNIPVEIACYITLRVCEGLDYAHNKKDSFGRELNIIHRDVSPQNILVSYEGEVKVIDFGIAKAANKASRTQAGILKGKFGYMSPEQVRGLPFDKRSDIFSAGIVLYELLTCERLFLGETDFSTLEKVRNVDIIPPRQHNPLISPELERIVLKALARNPDDRYQTAMELHSELQHYLFTSGTLCTRKELTEHMKKTFAREIDKERMKHEEYRKVLKAKKPATPPPPPPPQALKKSSDGIIAETGGNGLDANTERLIKSRAASQSQVIKPTQNETPNLSWDEDEIETQVFDKEVNELPSKSALFNLDLRQNSVAKPLPIPSQPSNKAKPIGMVDPTPLPVNEFQPPTPTRSRPYLILLIITLCALIGAGAYVISHIVRQRNKPADPPPIANPSVSIQVKSSVPLPGPFPVTVKIDDKTVHRGATDKTPFMMDVTEGPHTVVITSPNYSAYNGRFEAKKGIQNALEITLNRIPKVLPPVVRTGRLIFQSLPPKSRVFVDNKLTPVVGIGPLELTAGVHAIRIVPADKRYGPFSVSLTVRAGGILPPLAVKFPLLQVQLAFKVTPANAFVLIKDPQGQQIYQGRVPEKPLALKPNVEYSIEVQRRTFETFKKTAKYDKPDPVEEIVLKKERKVKPPRIIKVKRPDPKRPDPKRPTPPIAKKKEYGTLSLNSRPAAMILINGVRAGNTPLIGRKLKTGSYTITLISLSSKTKKSFRVSIKANQPTRKFVPLPAP